MPPPSSLSQPHIDPARGPLTELSPRAKLDRLLKIARGKRHALILTHDNPDPDCIASSVGLAYFLEHRAGIDARAGFGGIIGRAENVAMVRELKLTLLPVSRILFEEYDLVGLVDTQPSVGNHSLPARYRADLVVDHHPLREPSLEVPFADVGGDYGATSTLVTQYLQASKLPLPTEIATALFYGIKADTRDLGRQTTRADVDAYLWLFPQVDKALLGRIEHPELPARYFRLYHKAIERAKVYGAAIVVDLGEVYSPDMVAEVAERLLSLEGRKWSLAFGSYRSQLYFSLRTRDRRMNAGRLMREICEDRRSSAGGHGSMAGARIPLSGTQKERQTRKRQLVRKFLEEFGVAREKPESLLTSEAF